MNIQGLLGIVAILGIACLFSLDKRNIKFRTVLLGVFTQFVIAVIILKIGFVKEFFISMTGFVHMLERATHAGTSFVLGYLGGGDAPFAIEKPQSSFILAFQALPLVLVISALSSLLFYWRILPFIIKILGYGLQKILNIGGALSLGSAANIFFGMDSAPLVIRPHLEHMSRSELFAFMTTSMATVAGTVMVLYAQILEGVVDNVIGHIITASVINIPAAITVARIMIPDTQGPTAGTYDKSSLPKSAMDAITKGTTDGLHVLLCIAAMLIALLALVDLANQILAFLPMPTGYGTLTLQSILGYLMKPVVWVMGIPWDQAQSAGALIGTKVVLNELVAYIELSNLPVGTLDDRSRMMMIYAMCGFANFGSVGIMIACMSSLVPSRRDELVELSLRSLVSGTLATLMTGTIVGILL